MGKKKDEQEKKEKKKEKEKKQKKQKERDKKEKKQKKEKKRKKEKAREEAALEARERSLLRRARLHTTEQKAKPKKRKPKAEPEKVEPKATPVREPRKLKPSPKAKPAQRPVPRPEPDEVTAEPFDVGPSVVEDVGDVDVDHDDHDDHQEGGVGEGGVGEGEGEGEGALSDGSAEAIEAHLDHQLREALGPGAAVRASEIVGEGSRRLAARFGAESAAPRPTSFMQSAREMLSTDSVLRAWGQLGMRGRSTDVDDYGLDPKVEERWQPFFDFLYDTYWRVKVRGVEHIPDRGGCLLVGNHSGTVPYDGAMIKTAVARGHAQRRAVRWLAEDFVFQLPFVGAFANRIGAVRACQENAERMLREERLVAVFPEGVKGIGKLYKERYQLQRFGRGGYIKLVLRTGTPIVPVAVVGAEEIHPLLLRGRTLANMVGIPYIPVTPTFPWLGPLGLVPLPSQWSIAFGEPITFDDLGPDAAEDPILVNRLNDQVRAKIQTMVDGLLEER